LRWASVACHGQEPNAARFPLLPPSPSFAGMLGDTRRYSWWGLISIVDRERASDGDFLPAKIKRNPRGVVFARPGWGSPALDVAGGRSSALRLLAWTCHGGVCILGALVGERFQSLVPNALCGTESLWAVVRADRFPPQPERRRRGVRAGCLAQSCRARDCFAASCRRRGAPRGAAPAARRLLRLPAGSWDLGPSWLGVTHGERAFVRALCAATAHAETTFSA